MKSKMKELAMSLVFILSGCTVYDVSEGDLRVVRMEAEQMDMQDQEDKELSLCGLLSDGN